MLFILENSHKNDGSDLWKEFPFITQMIFEKKQIYSEEKNSNVNKRIMNVSPEIYQDMKQRNTPRKGFRIREREDTMGRRVQP